MLYFFIGVVLYGIILQYGMANSMEGCRTMLIISIQNILGKCYF